MPGRQAAVQPVYPTHMPRLHASQVLPASSSWPLSCVHPVSRPATAGEAEGLGWWAGSEAGSRREQRAWRLRNSSSCVEQHGTAHPAAPPPPAAGRARWSARRRWPRSPAAAPCRRPPQRPQRAGSRPRAAGWPPPSPRSCGQGQVRGRQQSVRSTTARAGRTPRQRPPPAVRTAAGHRRKQPCSSPLGQAHPGSA